VTTPEGRWTPGIGDPTVLGWVTVAAYAAAFVLCLACARRETRGSASRRFWLASAIIMALLGVNKQLDLQTWFTQVGRDLALAQGWYERRQVVQVDFIAALALGALGAAWALLRAVRDLGTEINWAGVGLVFLAAFVLIRAASFHHVDRLLGLHIGGVTMNAVLELGGIACVGVAAAARRSRSRSKSRD
jgi:hypothetical protein